MVQEPETIESAPVFARRRDFFFIIALLFVSGVAWFAHSREGRGEISRYRIQIFSQPPQMIELESIPAEPLHLQGILGPATVEFRADGAVRIASSTCHEEICMNYGWIKSGSLICVPNGVVVSVEKGRSDVDAISR
ncbi:MAG: NusG domain II-containing protein [Candidatus Rifleibacteriota bacterium]